MGIRAAAFLAFALALPALPAGAATLYKSVAANGTITFSDVPPEGARVLEARVIGPASSGNGDPLRGLPRPLNGAEQMLTWDPLISEANQQVDLAERALAEARRGTWSPREGLRLAMRGTDVGAVQRVEFYKRNLLAARKALLELLQERALAFSQPLPQPAPHGQPQPIRIAASRP